MSAPVGLRPLPQGAGSGSRGGVVRRRRLGLVAARLRSISPLLAATGRRGLRQHVGKVPAPPPRPRSLRLQLMRRTPLVVYCPSEGVEMGRGGSSQASSRSSVIVGQSQGDGENSRIGGIEAWCTTEISPVDRCSLVGKSEQMSSSLVKWAPIDGVASLGGINGVKWLVLRW